MFRQVKGVWHRQFLQRDKGFTRGTQFQKGFGESEFVAGDIPTDEDNATPVILCRGVGGEESGHRVSVVPSSTTPPVSPKAAQDRRHPAPSTATSAPAQTHERAAPWRLPVPQAGTRSTPS